MELVLFAIIVSVALHKAWEKGKTEYAHTRDKAAAEFSRAHTGWSPARIQRHARRRARGYWWDQIRHGWPDYRRAHAEARDLAEAERHETDLTFAQRRAELRRRIDAAQAERDRLQREEMERNRERAEELRRSAPCPYCGVAGGVDCKPDCPDRMAREANRARDAEPTEPPRTESPAPTKPPDRATGPTPTEPGRPNSTEPPRPSHGGTEPSPTVPPASVDSTFASHEDLVAWATAHRCLNCGAKGELRPRPGTIGAWDLHVTHPADCPENPTVNKSGEPAIDAEKDKFWAEHDADRQARDDSLRSADEYNALSDEEKEQLAAEVRAKLAGGGNPSNGTVTSINKNQPPIPPTANGTATPSGGTMATPATTGGNSPAVPTGEFGGYEATVAGWDNIGRHCAALDAAYERQMANLRALNADDATIERVARAREASEMHMVAAGEARTDWVSRQGAVKDTKDATGARGDQAMHDN
jgi:hypothetical protein